MNRFWMVWNEGNQNPRVKHSSSMLARSEAERLARSNPGQKFYVLDAIDCCMKRDVEWASEGFMNEVPF